MVQKIPPPPLMVSPELQQLNRWLLEIQAILNNSGDINPSVVQGLPEVIAQSAANAAAIAVLQGQVGGNTASIAAINLAITAINAAIVAINGQLTTLGARAQVFNGTGAPAGALGANNDWYYNRTGGVGARLYIKVAGAWVAQAI